MTYKVILLIIILLGAVIFMAFKGSYFAGNSQTHISQYNSLVWADEFDSEGPLDSEKWFHQTKLPPGGSWWGGLVQHYTNRVENTYMKDGYLHMVAKKETFKDQGVTKQYTSARLNSKYTFQYGRVEVRAKMPKGKGTWPAIWMLNRNISEDGAFWFDQYGTTSWPHCGEIDILEHWGKNQDYLSSAVHTTSSYGADVVNLGGRKIEEASDQFHIYSLDWSPEKMVFSIDGIVHYTYQPKMKNKKTWPFDEEYYLLLNVAVEHDIDPNFEQSAMVVDYLRIYQ
ncbi:MAG: glycoside hydrolase family 16 protein [Bacteroidota bacterium]